MPFPYKYICDLLQQLDDEARKPPRNQANSDEIVRAWFQQHRCLINATGNDSCAILSTLLPERRTDRVYNIQAPKLQSIFGKSLNLGASHVLELRQWSVPGSNLDLADCVEAALQRTPNNPSDTTHLTVEEIDEALGRVAATCRFSSPAVRALRQVSDDPNALLTDLYWGLSSRDAKWFTRLVLKNYRPVELNEYTVFRSYHPLLPQMIKIRDDLATATAYVRHIDETRNAPETIASILKPRLGTKVGRQPWFKGRSIKNCMDMMQGREVICEQKLDGEYCQIHIDLRKHRNCIQIFSKSGKDSTADRIGLHRAHDHEHLMIIYYDVLLIDDESLLGVKNTERFRRLSKIVTCRRGYAELVSRTAINASRSSAVPALRELFAQCIASRGEGLVLKPDEPYFDFNRTSRRYGCCNIKLKKEYIQGWGDVGDFAVVGASYNAAKAKEYRLPNVKWTHFFIGCLENGNQARSKTEMPRFRVTNIVELTGPVLSTFWTQGGPMSVPYKENKFIGLDYSGSALPKKPTVVFPHPLVFDMRCFAFDKEPNTNFWSMRFPQVAKVHYDRSYLDTIAFSELQKIAEAATHVPEEEDSQEMRQWVKALEKMDRGKFILDAQSQATTCSDASQTSSASTPPRRTNWGPGRDLVTPPRSSAVEATQTCIKHKTGNSIPPGSRGAKRPVTEQSGPRLVAKQRCESSGTSSVHLSQGNIPTSPTSTRMRPREPLSQVDPNASQNLRPESQNHPPSLPPTALDHDDASSCAGNPGASSPVPYYTASEMVSSSPSRTSRIP
ncbi:hypothetical protein NPX13_g7823 [Xylaria arbuscula]|uniref:ATP-dependent DNA ligase family profile domain-containing protein n=1 Tax=Xylaria arbuscula TaxID=114810 RepID=A0A9W8N9S4_9PEZI|nr:hypothetical protein NPX13_g7823 [Xylaria arbuscula]